MHASLSQDRSKAAPGRRPHPRRVRVAESVYQRVDRASGKPVPGKYEFTYRDATGRQVWQTSKGDTKADAESGARRAARADAPWRTGPANEHDRGRSRTAVARTRHRPERPLGTLDARRLRANRAPAHRTLHRRQPTPARNRQAARAEHRPRRPLVTGERARARTHHGRHRPGHARPGLPLRRPPRLAGQQPRRQARTSRETALDAQAGRDPRTRAARPATRTRERWLPATPTPACGSAKRSASTGPTSTTRPH